MIVAPPELASMATWNALDDATRGAVVTAVAQALGEAYEAGPGLVGAARMGCVRHVPTGYELVLVPGGSFEMGISEAEEQAIVEVLASLSGFATEDPEQRAGHMHTIRSEVAGIARAARPVHTVSVRPFLCGRRHRGELELVAGWRDLCEAEWEFVARAGSDRGWLLEPPLEWDGMEAPERALAQQSALGLFDLVSWDGEGFAHDGWPDGGGYHGAPGEAVPYAPEGSERNAIARGGPTYEWASEVAGVWAFFAGARSNAYGKGYRAAISFAP